MTTVPTRSRAMIGAQNMPANQQHTHGPISEGFYEPKIQYYTIARFFYFPDNAQLYTCHNTQLSFAQLENHD